MEATNLDMSARIILPVDAPDGLPVLVDAVKFLAVLLAARGQSVGLSVKRPDLRIESMLAEHSILANDSALPSILAPTKQAATMRGGDLLRMAGEVSYAAAREYNTEEVEIGLIAPNRSGRFKAGEATALAMPVMLE